MLYRLETHLSIVFAILVAVMLAVATTVPADGTESMCPQTIEQASEEWSDTGDRFSFTSDFDTEALMAFVTNETNASPELVADFRSKAAYIATARSGNWPPVMVVVGVFDAERCVIGGMGPVPITLLLRYLDIEYPAPNGPSI